jgi:polyisoprenoid-binding protein YceI
MKKTLLSIPALVITSFVSQASELETYTIDASHSSVKFSIRHFVAKTTGNFTQFEGNLSIDRKDLTQSSVEASIQIPSVDTDSEKRDAHLQKDDYFNTAKYPLMTFKSTQWQATDTPDEFKVTGDLSFNGITNPVTLDVELLGFGAGPHGTYLSGWEASTTLDRTKWGVNGGQPAVGNEVDITINIEAQRE